MVTFSILTNANVLNLLGCAHLIAFPVKQRSKDLVRHFFHDNSSRYSFFTIALPWQIRFQLTVQTLLHLAKIKDH